MKLSRTSGYAISALILLHGHGQDALVPCSKLAKAGQMPERFLLQILRQMVNCGILQSVRGVEGGYRLAREAGQISVHDVVAAVEGPPDAGLPAGCQIPAAAEGKLQGMLIDIADGARSVMQRVTVLDLVGMDPAAGRNQV